MDLGRRRRRKPLGLEPLELRRLFASDVSVPLSGAYVASGATTTRFAQRTEILGASPLQNAEIALDVNQDGDVTPLDALGVINVLNSLSEEFFPKRDSLLDAQQLVGDRPDVDGDGSVRPVDALQIINWLNAPTLLAGNDGFILQRNASEMSLMILDNDLVLPGLMEGIITSVSETSAGGSIQVIDGTRLLYSPPIDFVGIDTLTYEFESQVEREVSSSYLATGTIHILITDENHPPVPNETLAPIVLDAERTEHVFDLSLLFDDEDIVTLGDRLVYSFNKPGDALLNTILTGALLTVSATHVAYGTAIIELIATDLSGTTGVIRLAVESMAPPHPPTATTLTQNTIVENSPAGSVIGKLLSDASDPNILFELVSGEGDTDNARFEIDGNILTANEVFDYELQSAFSVRVRATDREGALSEDVLKILIRNVNEAPDELNLSSLLINEKLDIGSIVGEFQAVDPDAADEIMFQFVDGEGSVDNDKFSIDANQLILSESPNFARQSRYQIRVAAVDREGLARESTFQLEVVAAVFELPQIVFQTISVAEDIPVGTVIGSWSAVGGEGEDTWDFRLAEGSEFSDNQFVELVGYDIITTSLLDFETKSVLALRFELTSDRNQDISSDLTISILDVNEPPFALDASNLTIEENALAEQSVALLSASDPDLNDLLSFSLVVGEGSIHNDAFRIDGATIYATRPFDFESEKSLTVRVSVSDFQGLTQERIFEFQVSNVNEAPTDIVILNGSVSEHAATGTVIGTLAALDPDIDDAIEFSEIDPDDSQASSVLRLNGNQIVLAKTLDFEIFQTASITVRATDQSGLSVEKTIVIAVQDEITEAPTDILFSSVSIVENSSLGQVVGRLTAIDENLEDSFIYQFVTGAGDEHNGWFEIVGDELALAHELDFEHEATLSIRVRATDSSGFSIEKSLGVEVIDSNEPPTQMTLVMESLFESTPLGSVVGIISFADPDLNDRHLIELVLGEGDTDNVLFELNENQLLLVAPLNFEAQSTLSIRVKVSDVGGLFAEQEFTLAISDANEAPEAILLANDIINSDWGAGSIVSTLGMTDPDANDVFQFELVDGQGSLDNGHFSINENQLMLLEPLDYARQTFYRIRIRGIDSGGLSVEQSFTLVLRNKDVEDFENRSYQWSLLNANAAFPARDGAGILVFRNELYMIGGWNPNDLANFPRTTSNDVWKSADGIQWAQVKPNSFVNDTFDASTDWEGRHSAGYVVFQDKMWIIGGDASQGHYQSDVWNSEDGVNWTYVNQGVPPPWQNRALHQTLVFNDRIWVISGQTLPQYVPAAPEVFRDIWTTTDGIHWEQVTPQADYWSGRGTVSGFAVLDNRIWLLGGGVIENGVTNRTYYNDVWASGDGIYWEKILDESLWTKRMYQSVSVYDDQFWVIAGYSQSGDLDDVWRSPDGIHWYQVKDTPWAKRHAASTFVFQDALWIIGGSHLQSDVWKLELADPGDGQT